MNKSIDWNDVDVLRKLPDGWYTVPSDSEYARSMDQDPWLKDNDTRDLAEKRYQGKLEGRAMRGKKRKKCLHMYHIRKKGFWICLECGLCERDQTQ